jgi:hypothetical protein
MFWVHFQSWDRKKYQFMICMRNGKRGNDSQFLIPRNAKPAYRCSLRICQELSADSDRICDSSKYRMLTMKYPEKRFRQAQYWRQSSIRFCNLKLLRKFIQDISRMRQEQMNLPAKPILPDSIRLRDAVRFGTEKWHCAKEPSDWTKQTMKSHNFGANWAIFRTDRGKRSVFPPWSLDSIRHAFRLIPRSLCNYSIRVTLPDRHYVSAEEKSIFLTFPDQYAPSPWYLLNRPHIKRFSESRHHRIGVPIGRRYQFEKSPNDHCQMRSQVFTKRRGSMELRNPWPFQQIPQRQRELRFDFFTSRSSYSIKSKK